MAPVNLTFVSKAAQAASVRDRWHDTPGTRVVVCLDEASFTRDEAVPVFGSDTTIVGRSDLGLSPALIFQEALSLAEKFFPANDKSWPVRVERWLLESHKRWLIYAVHSVRLIEAALERFAPQQVWVPEYESFPVTLSPDTDPANPLFFDLLPVFCRQAGISVNRAAGGVRNPFWPTLLPLKYVIGEWWARFRKRNPKASEITQRRPVMVGNLDNDFHRQFDLGRLGPAASKMFAWIRAPEALVPVELLLDRVGLPRNTRFAWLYDGSVNLDLGYPSGVKVRSWAGLHYLLKSFWHHARKGARLEVTNEKSDIPWIEMLYGAELPAIHKECRVAAAYYCVFEYERARSIFLRWQPQLFVTAADHWPYLPHFAAAKDLGIKTLSTESGLSFLKDNFAQKQADIVCVFGQSDGVDVATRCPAAQIILAGDALAPEKTVATLHRRQGPRRVLFVMSGRMFGWWFGSLIFDYPAYVKALDDFARDLRTLSEPVQVALKSHPVSDLHDLYDKMISSHGDIFVEHRREPMSEVEIAAYDAAVVFSAASAFTAELIRAEVPVVYFSGALTEFGKTYFKYQGLEVAGDVQETVAKLEDLLAADGQAARQSVLGKGESFLNRYVDPARRSFASVLEEILEPGSNNAV